jgi:hypothetical protein
MTPKQSRQKAAAAQQQQQHSSSTEAAAAAQKQQQQQKQHMNHGIQWKIITTSAKPLQFALLSLY